MKKYLLIILLLLVVGCQNKDISAKLNINCNGDVSDIEVKNNDVISCKLLDDSYKLNLEVKEDEITIKTNGELTNLKEDGTFNLIDKNDTFKLKKGQKITLITKTTDYQEEIIISWK